MSIFASSTVLNKYRVLSELGRGGMGRVWQAEEITFGNRPVAIKEPRTDIPAADLEEMKRRYQQEVQIYFALQKVGAPNLVQVYTVERFEDNELLVMAYMPGGDLQRLLRQHPNGLPLEKALGITAAVLGALRAGHEHPMEIVHRDVKPSNILFDAAGNSHLADFGLAQLAGMSGRSQLQIGRSHPGTPAYMAPEQANMTDYLNPAADIYAVGCVLFEMITGKRFKRMRPGTTVSSMRNDIPAWLDALVARTLAEDPFDRYEDANQMLTWLDAGMVSGTIESETQTIQVVEDRKQQTKGPILDYQTVALEEPTKKEQSTSVYLDSQLPADDGHKATQPFQSSDRAATSSYTGSLDVTDAGLANKSQSQTARFSGSSDGITSGLVPKQTRNTVNSLLLDMRRAISLDRAFYREVSEGEHYQHESLTVVVVVAIASFIGGILDGILRQSFTPMIQGLIGAILAVPIYYIWAYLVKTIGARLFKGKATTRSLQRSLGFAYSPSIASILAFIPILGPLIVGCCSIWSFVCQVFAVRETHQITGTQSVVILLLPGAVIGVVFIFFALVVTGLSW